MKTFVVTPRAARDLAGVWEYLAEQSIEAADRTLGIIEKTFYKLAKQPGLGHLRQDLADGRYRFFLVHSYFIIYRSMAEPLEVIRVLHAARDIQGLLNIPSDDPPPNIGIRNRGQ